MLYLVGGASRSGKSKITHMLLKQYGISYFSLDYLKMGFHRGLPEFGISANDPSHIVAEKMWSYTKGVLTTIMDTGEDFVIEGDSLYPKYVNELIQDEKYKNLIRACFLGYPNALPEKKLGEIRTFGDGANNWIADKSDDYVLGLVQGEIERSKKLEKECQEFNLHFVDTSNDFEARIQGTVDYLIKPPFLG